MSMPAAILTDIEGTTSSLAFVHEVLFPYARARVEEFLYAHAGEPAVRAQIEAVCHQAGRPLQLTEVIATLHAWIDADRKLTPLKALQGMIWEQGYQSGELHGHVYDDAVRGLRRWHARGLRLYIYSSGSVQAQRLLFGHTAHGDLTPLFAGYFDTTTGPKRDPASYRTIARQVDLPAGQILFLSDTPAELDAAREAGLDTCCLARGDTANSELAHPCVLHFDDILP